MNPYPLPPPIPSPSGEMSPPEMPPLEPAQNESNRFGRTVGEALSLCVANIVLSVLLDRAHLKFFLASEANSNGLQKLMAHPLQLMLLVVVLAPVCEELLFRGLPSLLVRRIWRWRNWSEDARSYWFWGLGSIAAFLFSIAHGGGDKTLHLPLPQLLMGFILWHTAMQRGLRYSMLMHATYNLLPGLLILSQATRH